MKNLEITSLNCPFCKKRISTWCRKAKNVDALIDQKLWATIQKDFDTEVQARLAGAASTLFVEGGFTHEFTFEDGAIGKEFQDQIEQIQAEENRRRDKELVESRRLIESIQLEERLGDGETNNVENRNNREQQNGHDDVPINDDENRDEFEATDELIELQRQLEARIEQQKKDEEFARQLQEEFRENSITSSPGVSTRRRSSSSRSTSSKKSPNCSKQTKGPRQMTLDGFFGRKRKREED